MAADPETPADVFEVRMRTPARGGLWISALAVAGLVARLWRAPGQGGVDGLAGPVPIALAWDLTRLGLVVVLVLWAARMALAPFVRVQFGGAGARVLGPWSRRLGWDALGVRWGSLALVLEAGGRRSVLWFPDPPRATGWLVPWVAERSLRPGLAARGRSALVLLAVVAAGWLLARLSAG